MTEIKHKYHILEAIDQLRRRKARPDIDRICNFVTKRFAVDSKETKADLQRCVENAIVFKVEYKGSISYRNAAKKSYGNLKKDPNISIPSTSTASNQEKAAENIKAFANIITTVMADLCLEDSDYLDYGVPPAELVKKIMMKHGAKFSRKTITDLLQNEVDNGGLIKMPNGNYSLGRTSEKDDDDEYLTVNTSNDGSPPIKIRKKPGPKPGKRKNEMEKIRNAEEASVIGIRMGGRRKRAKKVFDPSDNNLPRANRKRGRPLGSLNKSTIEKQTAALLHARTHSDSVTGSFSGGSNNVSDHSPGSRPTSRASSVGFIGGSSNGNSGNSNGARDQGGVCSVCHIQGKKGPNDKMISCRECSNKAHVSCLNSDDGMLKMYPDNTWQCPHCKTCTVCYETSDAGTLTVCIICADAYHSFCHEPKIIDKPKGSIKWVCCNCEMEPLLNDIKQKTEIKEDSDKNEDKISLNLSIEQSTPSPTPSEESSPFLRSPANSPTPPALSPQNNHLLLNGNNIIIREQEKDNRNHESGNGVGEFKYFNMTMSDSQSVKDFDVEEGFDPTIPDASNWTYDDVYNYFVQYFPEEAIVFKEQEIDGHSLLLMKRVDVLTSLNLKLGPALKIYRHVLKLQVRRDDHKLYWL